MQSHMLTYPVSLVERGVVGTVSDGPPLKALLVHADRLLHQSVKGEGSRFSQTQSLWHPRQEPQVQSEIKIFKNKQEY